MLILFLSLLSFFNYQEIGGSASASQISSVGNSSYLATAINPAILSQLDKNNIGIVYACPYNISEIQYTRLAGNYKNFGINISRLGQTGFGEYVLSISSGFNLTPALSYGLIVKGLYLDLDEYGQTFLPALNFGISYHLDKLELGAVVENINHPQNSMIDNIPWSIIAGALFTPVQDFSCGLEIQKTNLDQNIALGAEFKPLPNLCFRLGAKTNPIIASTGLGFVYKNFSLDYSLKFHTRLKDTSIISLGYSW
ncbi:MAG: hypothetical protein KGZ86_00675 [Candidatus Latescibacteria bacterium]|nr:hypothetical protein [Candidatus Latescibacterota bacterium]